MALTTSDIHLCEQSQCTGCMACKQKCRAGAIDTEASSGFNYPIINKDICKACGMCMNACPILNLKGVKGNCHEETKTCLAAWNKSIDVREKSSSGGIFTVFAEYVLSIGGVVFGAAWDSNMVLKHKAVEKMKDLDSIRRSKYVQSDVNTTFRQAELFLKEGRTVLYCGTHCQIAGLNSYLGKKYNNLFLIDILCQGVPAPELLKKYFFEIEAKYKLKISDCNFRSKKKAWKCGLSLELTFENGKHIQRSLSNNEYYNAFFCEFFMRSSCYDCKFKTKQLGYFSDITLADFWRIGNKVPLNENHYEKGISAVVVNTEQGSNLLSRCKDSITTVERTWNEFSTNGGLYVSSKPTNNDAAYEYLKNHNWRETQQKFFPMGIRKKISNLLLLTFGEKYVRMVKKALGRL